MKKTKAANILLAEDEPAVQELPAFDVQQCNYRFHVSTP